MLFISIFNSFGFDYPFFDLGDHIKFDLDVSQKDISQPYDVLPKTARQVDGVGKFSSAVPVRGRDDVIPVVKDDEMDYDAEPNNCANACLPVSVYMVFMFMFFWVSFLIRFWFLNIFFVGSYCYADIAFF